MSTRPCNWLTRRHSSSSPGHCRPRPWCRNLSSPFRAEPMQTNKPIASLSLDLDNQWSYMKTHGDAGWESLPSYLDIVVPRVLRLLKEKGLTITFFIVGLDADQERNHAVLRSIAEAGHEIGNHSFQHEPWLHLYSQEQLLTEITKAE